MNFGEKLRLLRTEKGWHQPELAEKLGIEQSYLSKLENGHSLPSGEILDNVLASFDIPLETLLQDLDEAVIRKHLGNIPLVANHLSASAARVNGNRKRWLVMASFCVAAGFSLVIAGALLLRNPEQIYNYVSDSIIPMGANGEVFTTLEEYVEYAVAPLQLELVDADISPAERHERITRETERINYSLAPLKFHHFLSSPQSRGRYFTDELTDMADWDVLVAAGINTGGTRTYASEGSTPIDGSMPVWLAIAGSFLALWGMLAFMIAAPLFKRNN